TLSGIPPDLNVRDTTLFQWPNLSVHNLNRFLDEMKLVIDLGFIQRKSKCFARISISSGLTRERYYGLCLVVSGVQVDRLWFLL
ncbi:hypothetical protein Tco_1299112, partial [Tanacetum coccineum]